MKTWFRRLLIYFSSFSVFLASQITQAAAPFLCRVKNTVLTSSRVHAEHGGSRTMVRTWQQELDVHDQTVYHVYKTGPAQLSFPPCLLLTISPPAINNCVSFLYLPETFGLIGARLNRLMTSFFLCTARLLATSDFCLLKLRKTCMRPP